MLRHRAKDHEKVISDAKAAREVELLEFQERERQRASRMARKLRLDKQAELTKVTKDLCFPLPLILPSVLYGLEMALVANPSDTGRRNEAPSAFSPPVC